MYCSMLVMMIMNIVFLKLIMSAMAQMSSGGVLIWLVFVVALTRVARKIDSHIGKIGLNPAQTGNALGSRLPGMVTMAAVRVMSGSVSKSIAAGKSAGGGVPGKRTDGKSRGGNIPGRQQRTSDSTSHKNTQGASQAEASRGAENRSYQSGASRAETRKQTNSRSHSEKESGTRPPIPRNTQKDKNGGVYQSRESEKAERDNKEWGVSSDRTKPKGTYNYQNRDSKTDINGVAVNIDSKNSSRGYAESSAEFSRSDTDSARWNENVQINHEYVSGRYDPAARNKKAKTRGYRKYTKKEDERGGSDRKQKR